MSIPNIIYKIKSQHGIDTNTIMFLLIIVGVGIGSFGLGRLSYSIGLDENISNKSMNQEEIIVLSDENTKKIDILALEPFDTKEKRYVASKNGKIYYSIDCSGAARIKPENRIWFSTAQDAEKSGFTKSSKCK